MNKKQAFEAFQFLIGLYTEDNFECETNFERRTYETTV